MQPVQPDDQVPRWWWSRRAAARRAPPACPSRGCSRRRSSPSTDSAGPSHSTRRRRRRGTAGRTRTARTAARSATAWPASRRHAGERRDGHDQDGYAPKAQNSSRGVETTAIVNATIATILTSGGSRWTGCPARGAARARRRPRAFSPCRRRRPSCRRRRPGWWSPRHRGRGRAAGPARTCRPPTANVTSTPVTPGSPSRRSVADTRHAVVGERAVGQLVVLGVAGHAVAAGDLVVLVERAALERGRVEPVRASRTRSCSPHRRAAARPAARRG